jgi:Ca2+-transporting ATPase
MLHLSNPLNAMQILFINILMDGPCTVDFRLHFIYPLFCDPGPPSQSLGVDPVDPAIMRRPPRKKDAPIITQRLLYRVLFSASIIVVGTLFVYIFALSDDKMSKREQTMVCPFAFFFLLRGCSVGLLPAKRGYPFDCFCATAGNGRPWYRSETRRCGEQHLIIFVVCHKY